jgi:hypothetical protein
VSGGRDRSGTDGDDSDRFEVATAIDRPFHLATPPPTVVDSFDAGPTVIDGGQGERGPFAPTEQPTVAGRDTVAALVAHEAQLAQQRLSQSMPAAETTPPPVFDELPTTLAPARVTPRLPYPGLDDPSRTGSARRPDAPVSWRLYAGIALAAFAGVSLGAALVARTYLLPRMRAPQAQQKVAAPPRVEVAPVAAPASRPSPPVNAPPAAPEPAPATATARPAPIQLPPPRPAAVRKRKPPPAKKAREAPEPTGLYPL